MNKEDVDLLLKDNNYIFSEVSAKTAQNINTLFYKDIHDAIMYKYKIGCIDKNDKTDEIQEKQVESKYINSKIISK